MKRQEYIEMLEKGICNVTFKKADGSTRQMRATLLNEYLPEFETHRGEKVKSYIHGGTVVQKMGTIVSTKDVEPATVTVWDLDEKGWRSFRMDSVQKILQE